MQTKRYPALFLKPTLFPVLSGIGQFSKQRFNAPGTLPKCCPSCKQPRSKRSTSWIRGKLGTHGQVKGHGGSVFELSVPILLNRELVDERCWPTFHFILAPSIGGSIPRGKTVPVGVECINKRNTWCNISVRQRSDLLREPTWKYGRQILLREPLSIPATAARDCSSSFCIFVLTQLVLKKALFGESMSVYKQTPDFRCRQKFAAKND